MRTCPSTFVIFSDITLSKPFRIESVIKRAEIPIDRPNTDKMVAVLTKPLLWSDLICFKANKRLIFNFFLNYSFFIAGNKITSFINLFSVKSITSLSIPMPTPPVGGIPHSIACRKFSSTG